jgi:hypothetical protein
MFIFNIIFNKVSPGSVFQTPSGRSSYTYRKSNRSKVYLEVGTSGTIISIPSQCFDNLPEYLDGKGWVRIGATHGIPPRGSIDEYLQQLTGGLSVASYVLPILEELDIIEIQKTRPMRARYIGDTPWQLWAYDPSWNDFRPYKTIEKWKENIDYNGAIQYLERHIKKSVQDDFEPAYNAYVNTGTGYFSMLRMLFPFIDFLGTLYKGNRGQANAVSFIQDYLGRINEKYKQIGDLMWYVFRHGLIHTHMPKVIFVGGKNIGWVITFRNKDHLKISSEGLKPLNIYVCPHQLYIDLLESINQYIMDFKIIENKEEMLDKFKEGFIDMAKFYTTQEMNNKCNDGINYLNDILPRNNY